MIKTVNVIGDMVVVFDGRGQQMPEYQGFYGDEALKKKILRNAPPNATFAHGYDGQKLIKVPRKKW